ncbi:glycosyltransferase family 39 protein [Rhabdobacter roseus]|uniref:4-amino-4-deoxy-L-arabinose transferase-like glycosyltransferase n=1 Tax=Rhabdobacter roseus TaxID=1655419 RepID=A0A840U675_9BACT|nr:glycosyltransferase family 39 protein [Rhabdobacter roseus]MBB5287560.1 4-amino-4-deoxy-L-arabinose transferase-like glycosyltransferase [Rhabdobacter roseus]
MKIFSLDHRWWLVGIVLFGFFWNLGNAPLFDEDEGFFAEGTREMALRGDFIATYVNQEPRFDKPPLTNWLQYLSAQLLGWTEAAMRLPSALAALGWMLLLYRFVRRALGEREAFFATLMATCSLQITIIGKAALADSLLNAFLAGAMFCLYEVLQKVTFKYLLAFYGFTALGFLAKGPIAVLVPGAVTGLYLLRWRAWKPLLRVLHPLGMLLFLGLALPWYWLQYRQMGQAFIDGFFFNHNLNRFQTAFEGHYGGVLYFVPVLLLGTLPYTAVVLSALGQVRRLWADRYLSFHLLWFGFVFVFFSFSGTKLHHYLVYGYTPLFVLGARYLVESKRLPVMWPALALLLLLAGVPFGLPWVLPYVQDAYAVAVMQGAAAEFGLPYLLTMGLLMGLVVLVGFRKTWSQELRALLVGGVLLVTVNGLWMPRLGNLLQRPIKEAALLAKEKDDQRLVVLDHYTPSFHFYSGRFAQERAPRPGDTVLARKDRLVDFPTKIILYEKYGIVLARLPD